MISPGVGCGTTNGCFAACVPVRFQRLIVAMADWVEGGPWLVRWQRRVRRDGARSLDAYCTRELNRWRKRLIRKGRDLENLTASRRHRLRIRSKRFRYMLEALTETSRSRPRRIKASARAGEAPAARLGRSSRSHAPRRPCPVIGWRRWQTKGSTGLPPSQARVDGGRDRGLSRPQAGWRRLTLPFAARRRRQSSGVDVHQA